ncbi:uncharacterized protein BDR25DRAFT_252513 [Lindgomyces ingoldianus]|uniref:Uncharacterized protein n=1 Tax=Lindgomyces ingoldianus TaxID=673940 RepID=A0ACB6RCJ8_9PLEO|nr:uncharacterized protein BDR25DRAFT_252513 [Lindgomyces ingoldianus]KAF2476483.1 hypothetical protein BDR25DRAFT_252513 [Lindgomyces ingoldianus]
MGSHTSKPHGAYDQAVEYPTATAQVLQDDSELNRYPFIPLKQPPVGNPWQESPSTFPSELPERPPKHSRFSLRRSSLKGLPPTPPATSPAPLFPLSPPQSTNSTRFEPVSPPSSDFDPTASRITPPASPVPGRFGRKPFRFDSVSQNLRSAVSSPNLTTSFNGRNFSRPSRRSRGSDSHESISAPSLTDLPLHRERPSPFGNNIPLEQGFSRLQLGRNGPLSQPETPLVPSAPVPSPWPLPTTTQQNNNHLHPIEEDATVGASRPARRRPARDISEPYQELSRRNIRKHTRRTQSEQTLKELPSHNESFGQANVSSNNGSAPETFPSASSSRSRTVPRASPSGPFPVTRRHAQNQEKIDRELAEQLQREEDEAYDLYSSLEPANPQSPPTRVHSPPQSPDDFFDNLYYDAPVLPIQNPSGGATSSGTRDDPVYSPEANFARELQQRYGDEIPLPDHERAQQEDTDAQIARQLQQEEEERRQRETSPSSRDCVVCGENTPIPEFPALAECAHEPDICVDCFKGWIASELNTKSWSEIKCPGDGCRVILKHHHVQQHADPEIYERFDSLSARDALNDDPNFRWCRGPGCKSGQIHLSGEEGNIFRCIACGFRVCVKHENTWHEDETCEEYDYRKSGKKERDQKQQEEASVKAIGELTKRCPGKSCKWPIEKNEGCDHMTCSKCRHEFCWICLAPYGPIRDRGNSAHKKHCKYHSSRLN